jgi:hypothetical protein
LNYGARNTHGRSEVAQELTASACVTLASIPPNAFPGRSQPTRIGDVCPLGTHFCLRLLAGTAGAGTGRLSSEQNKQLVRRLVDQAVAQHDLDLLDELAAGEFAQVAKRWVRPFQSAFPDFEMRVVELIAEGDTPEAAAKTD